MITFLVILALICLIITAVCVFLGIAGLALKFVCGVLGLVFSWKVLAWFLVFWLIFAIIAKPKNDKKSTENSKKS